MKTIKTIIVFTIASLVLLIGKCGWNSTLGPRLEERAAVKAAAWQAKAEVQAEADRLWEAEKFQILEIEPGEEQEVRTNRRPWKFDMVDDPEESYKDEAVDVKFLDGLIAKPVPGWQRYHLEPTRPQGTCPHRSETQRILFKNPTGRKITIQFELLERYPPG